ncbi:putative quinol monooxygenase [Granulosicoccus sp. 3-233]|uniref:putative quinol monooxygenase n=1 Tax=Granulosicoccus sp. 3-233 TaxID=3417969 RepID=UPI003D33E60C
MHGIIGKIIAVSGGRDALVRILLKGSRDLPGCLSYIVARDNFDEDTVWITEVWESRAAHERSLDSSAVQKAIAEGKHLISAFGHRVETVPVGGQDLPTVE